MRGYSVAPTGLIGPECARRTPDATVRGRLSRGSRNSAAWAGNGIWPRIVNCHRTTTIEGIWPYTPCLVLTIHNRSGLLNSLRFTTRASAWDPTPSSARFSPAPHGPVKRVDRHLVRAMEALRAAEYWRAHGVNQLSPETYAFFRCKPC